jgi:hypothetical protein
VDSARIMGSKARCLREKEVDGRSTDQGQGEPPEGSMSGVALMLAAEAESMVDPAGAELSAAGCPLRWTQWRHGRSWVFISPTT